MDTLFSIKVFCQVVQSGSFTRAADLLDISIPMASKHVAYLEKKIGTQLLYRNRRALKPTAQGEQYYRDSLTALELLDHAAEEAASGSLKKPRGILRVSVPLWFACDKFTQWMTEYGRRYPEVELSLTLSNRRIDLNSDGEDLALRLSRETLSGNIIARPLGEVPFYLVGTPAYLATHGTPAQPQDLSGHRAVLPSYTDMGHVKAHGREDTAVFELQPNFTSNNTLMTAGLIRNGAGLGYLPSWLVADDIRHGRLQHILPEYNLFQSKLYAVYADRRYMNAKLRSFIDFMVECCEQDPDTLPFQTA